MNFTVDPLVKFAPVNTKSNPAAICVVVGFVLLIDSSVGGVSIGIQLLPS